MTKLIRNITVVLVFFSLSCSRVYGYSLYSNIDNCKDQVIAVVKENEIWVVDTNNVRHKKLIDKGGRFSYPLISPEGYIAYKKNNDLYVCKVSFIQDNKPFKVTDNVASYVWQTNKKLLYSKDSGGLFIEDVYTKSNISLKAGRELYSKMVSVRENIIFAEKSGVKTINGHEYQDNIGIVKLDLRKNNETVIVEKSNINCKTGDSGINPKIAAVSSDGANVFIWCNNISDSSINLCKSQLGIYNDITGIFSKVSNNDVNTLSSNDNISICPNEHEVFAIINYDNFKKNIKKELINVNNTKNSIIKVTNNNETVMTPCYSIDGKKMAYSFSEADECPLNNSIYEFNIEQLKTKRLTNDKNVFDFAPRYLNYRGDIIFLRKNNSNEINLIKKTVDGQEIIIDKDILNEPYMWCCGHFDLCRVTNL